MKWHNIVHSSAISSQVLSSRLPGGGGGDRRWHEDTEGQFTHCRKGGGRRKGKNAANPLDPVRISLLAVTRRRQRQ